jgi:hypothetical protein
MAQGQPVTATPEQPHDMHVQIKTMALKNIVEKFGEDNPLFDIFMQNIMQHQSMMQAPASPSIGQAVTGAV